MNLGTANHAYVPIGRPDSSEKKRKTGRFEQGAKLTINSTVLKSQINTMQKCEVLTTATPQPTTRVLKPQHGAIIATPDPNPTGVRREARARARSLIDEWPLMHLFLQAYS